MKRNTGKRAPLFRGDRMGWLFAMPSLVLFMVVLAFPIVYAIGLSVFDISLDFSMKFAGLNNYVRAFSDQYFVASVGRTVLYTLASVAISVALGLAIALALNASWLKAKSLLQLLFLVPWTLSYVVTGVAWKWILNSSYGVLNGFLRSLNLISENMTILGNPSLAMPAVIFVNVWRNTPFAIITLYAGLQLVPTDQIEAALVDGTSPFQTFRYVTWPNLRGIISVTVILQTIWTFTQFDLTKVLTDGGGPNHATELLSNYIYRISFNYYQFGYGSAIAVLMLIIVLALTFAYQRTLEAD